MSGGDRGGSADHGRGVTAVAPTHGVLSRTFHSRRSDVTSRCALCVFVGCTRHPSSLVLPPCSRLVRMLAAPRATPIRPGQCNGTMMNASQNRYKETCFMYSNTEGHEQRKGTGLDRGGERGALRNPAVECKAGAKRSTLPQGQAQADTAAYLGKMIIAKRSQGPQLLAKVIRTDTTLDRSNPTHRGTAIRKLTVGHETRWQH